MQNKKILFFTFILILPLVIAFIHNVGTKNYKEDNFYIDLILEDLEISKTKPLFTNFAEEVDFINIIHSSILSSITNKTSIPINQSREPKDIYMLKQGECFDLSRLLEKTFQFYGYKTRHLSIYEKIGKYPLFNLFFKKGNDSHAVSQIKTSRGWLTVDSVKPWISLDNSEILFNISNIKNNKNWKYDSPHHIFDKEVYIIYGLYSRHGRFYPPYNFLPDINFLDFIAYNFTSIDLIKNL